MTGRRLVLAQVPLHLADRHVDFGAELRAPIPSAGLERIAEQLPGVFNLLFAERDPAPLKKCYGSMVFHFVSVVRNGCVTSWRGFQTAGGSDTIVAMAYFLFKTEPAVYSFDDFMRDKETIWDGVTNPTAVKFLREMKAGTKWIFYHTGDERTAVGTGTVVSVDPSDPKVPIVKVKVGKRIKTPKTLAQIKAEPLFSQSPLVIIGRLSVVPLTEDQWNWLVD